MLEITGCKNPTYAQICSFFSKKFPFKYLHSYSLYLRMVSPEDFNSDLYLKIFCEYEDKVFAEQKRFIPAAPTTNTIEICIDNGKKQIRKTLSVAPKTPLQPLSIIPRSSVVDLITEACNAELPGVPSSEIMVYNILNHQILFYTEFDDDDFPEDSSFYIRKREISVAVPAILVPSQIPGGFHDQANKLRN
jgi:hypothetical protein